MQLLRQISFFYNDLQIVYMYEKSKPFLRVLHKQISENYSSKLSNTLFLPMLSKNALTIVTVFPLLR